MDFLDLEQRIHADPRFRQAAIGICDDFHAFFASHPQASLLLGDQGQMRVAAICYRLDPMITTAAVKRQVPPTIASPNRVAAIIAQMRRRGALLDIASATGPARPMRLAGPSIDLVEAWLQCFMKQALPFVIGPCPDITDRRLYRGWCEQFLDATAAPTGSLKSSNEIERGQSMRGGALLYLGLVRRIFDDSGSDFSRRRFAADFGVSRTQVIELIADAEARGWLTHGEGQLHFTAKAIAAGERWMAKFLALGTATLEGRLVALLAASKARIAAAAEARAAADAARASDPG
jgi:hypothetical protein